MYQRFLTICFGLALLASPGGGIHAQAQTVLPDGISAGPVMEGISEYRLDNGLQVLLFPDSSNPTVTVNVTYLVGSAHENYGETGMAHLLEHLVFKGTPTHPGIPDEFKRRGISYNGTTWLERTNYFGSFPANDETLDWLLALEADRMVNSNIAQSDLDSEMTVVRNELEIGESDYRRVFEQRLRSQAYLWHNYGNSTIGNRADVENVPIDRLRTFYRTWYQPDNATLIVAGRIDPQRVLRTVQETFGRIPRPTRVLPPRYTIEPTQDGEREVNVRRVGGSNLVGAAYHVPPAVHPDNAPLQVLASVMSHVPGGRLHKTLVETGLAAASGSRVDAFLDSGLAVFTAEAAQGGDPAQAEKTLLGQVEGLADLPLTDEEVEAAKQRMINAYERVNNNVGDVARVLSEFIAIGDWRLWFAQIDALQNVTTEDVNRVAKAYLVPSNRTLARFIPTPEPIRAVISAAPSVASVVEGYGGRMAVAAGEAFDPTPQNILARTTVSTVGGDGLKVALLPKKNRGETVTATLAFRFGDEASITGRTDAGVFASLLLATGSTNSTREQIARRLDDLKSSVRIIGDAQRVFAVVASDRENLTEALRLAAEMLRTPAFAESEFEQLRSQQITRLEAVRDEPSQIAADGMRRHILGHWPAGHPRAFRSADQRLAAIKALTLEDVRAFHREFYGTSEGEVAVVGDFDPEEVRRELQALFADWRAPRPFARIPNEHRPIAATRESFETPDKANAVLIAHSRFPLTAGDPDHAALVVANHVFGGSSSMASRLANRIRQDEGLSYGIGSILSIDEMDDNSALHIQASTAPQNVAKLEAALREELERFVRAGITAQELADAGSGLLIAYANARARDQTVVDTLLSHLYLGRTMQWTADFEDAIRNLTLEQVNAAIVRHIRPETLSVFVAGDFADAERMTAAGDGE